jgi:hypothetical protein
MNFSSISNNNHKILPNQQSIFILYFLYILLPLKIFAADDKHIQFAFAFTIISIQHTHFFEIIVQVMQSNMISTFS